VLRQQPLEVPCSFDPSSHESGAHKQTVKVRLNPLYRDAADDEGNGDTYEELASENVDQYQEVEGRRTGWMDLDPSSDALYCDTAVGMAGSRDENAYFYSPAATIAEWDDVRFDSPKFVLGRASDVEPFYAALSDAPGCGKSPASAHDYARGVSLQVTSNALAPAPVACSKEAYGFMEVEQKGGGDSGSLDATSEPESWASTRSSDVGYLVVGSNDSSSQGSSSPTTQELGDRD
jgi:hypothetical protein